MSEEMTEEEMMEEQMEEQAEDQMDLQQELQGDYGAPVPDERHNQWTMLSKASEIPDTTKMTFLTESELGRPLFSVRFMIKLSEVAKHYLDGLLMDLNLDPVKYNAISNYFAQSSMITTDTGLSNKGFLLNLATTQKRDVTRTRSKSIQNLKNVKGGIQ